MRFEYKHLAFIGEESIRAAEASECANEQGMFWPYHDTLFLNQQGENIGTFNEPTLIDFATRLGMDEAAFTACLDAGQYRSAILDAQREAGLRDITITPTIVINGQIFVGALSFGEFQTVIEAELADLQGGE